MSFVAWLVLGFAGGFISGQLPSTRRESALPDILLGIGGALAGGWLFYTYGPPGVNGFHLQSLYAAVAGSVIVLLTFRGLKGQ